MILDAGIRKYKEAATLIVAALDSLHKERADYVCSGANDDVTIQQAIDALLTGGGKIILLDGEFSLSNALTITQSNVEIEGQSSSSILKVANGANCNAIEIGNGTNQYLGIVISKLKIDGNSANQTAASHGIYLNAEITWSYIHNTFFQNIYSDAIRFEGDNSHHNYIYNNVIKTCGAKGIGSTGDNRDNHITNNDIATTNDAAIQVSGIYCSVNDNLIIGPITTSGNGGIELNADGCSAVGNSVEYGINGSGIYGSADNLTITGNTIIGAGASPLNGIYLIASATYCNITGNNIISAKERGIYVCGTENLIASNFIYNVSLYHGIDIANVNCAVVGNFVLQSEQAGIHTVSDYTLIQGNIIKDSGQGATGFRAEIMINGSDYNDIRDNHLLATLATKTLYGIWFYLACGTHNAVTHNRISGPTIAAIYTPPAGTEIYRQHSDLFMDVLAVSATHVVDDWDVSAAGEIEHNPAAANQPDVPRTLSWNLVQHTNVTEFDLVFEGIDAKGNSITETITEAAGWSGETSNAFATISAIKYTRQAGAGDAGNIIDIGITDVLGLSNVIYATSDVYKIKKDNANVAVAVAQVNTTYDTYDMSVIGLAATNDFTIWFKSNLNIIS